MSLSERDIALVAADAQIDPRTARKFLVDGQAPRSRAIRAALAAALRKAGHEERAAELEGGNHG